MNLRVPLKYDMRSTWKKINKYIDTQERNKYINNKRIVNIIFNFKNNS